MIYVPGRHIILDMYGCAADISSISLAHDTLRTAAEAAGVTVLDISAHDFGEGQGVTALALLAESHLSVHSWPETSYVAADIFTCGRGDCDAAANVLLNSYRPERHTIKTYLRGKEPA